MRKVLDLKDDGFNYICKYDEKATDKPYRLYLSAYVLGEDGYAHHKVKQLNRYDTISDVLYALATVKSTVSVLKAN